MRVSLAGVLGNMGKSGDVCNVIFGRLAMISRRKNAKTSTNGSTENPTRLSFEKMVLSTKWFF